MIQQMKFSGYFLIVWDFIRFSKQKGIPVGPGRGSAAGSLVGYAMEITDIDPLEYGLLFERFLNPERISMPDIDIDFCTNRRGEVIQYVTEKYGREQVAQIITFGTLAAKAAIKDVGRVLDMSFAEVDRISKLVPKQLNIKLDQAIEDPELKAVAAREPRVKEVLDVSLKLEGVCPQCGHARRRRRHLLGPAAGTRSAVRHQQAGNCDAVRHGGPREARPAQDGLSGPDDADHHRSGARS